MAHMQLVLLFCICSMGFALGNHASLTPTREDGHRGVEIDGGSSLMRRDESPMAVARESGLLATLQSHGPAVEKQPLGTMVLLVDSDNEAEMKDLDEILVPSLIASLKFRTPIAILYSGARRPVDDSTFKLHLNTNIAPLTLVDVTQRVEQFAQEHVKHAGKNQGKSWKMNEFWLMHVHLLPELQHFHYAWRLSPKSSLLGDVTSDLYEVMHHQKAVLGYRLLKNSKLEGCSGLQAASQDFFKGHAEYAPKSVSAQAFLAMYEQAECPLWTSDFQLVNLDYLRNNEGYTDYVHYLADMGGFAKNEWAVPGVQTIFLATQEEEGKMLCMTPWVPSYHGETELSCGAGLGLTNFFQTTIKDQFAHAEVLEVGEVKKVDFAQTNKMLEDALKDVTTATKHFHVEHKSRGKRHISLGHIAVWRIIVLSVSGAIALGLGGFAFTKQFGKKAEEEPL